MMVRQADFNPLRGLLENITKHKKTYLEPLDKGRL